MSKKIDRQNQWYCPHSLIYQSEATGIINYKFSMYLGETERGREVFLDLPSVARNVTLQDALFSHYEEYYITTVVMLQDFFSKLFPCLW